MGKTTFAQKIIRQWAKGESWLSKQRKIVLHLDFNVLENAKRTVCLEELINREALEGCYNSCFVETNT